MLFFEGVVNELAGFYASCRLTTLNGFFHLVDKFLTRKVKRLLMELKGLYINYVSLNMFKVLTVTLIIFIRKLKKAFHIIPSFMLSVT